MEAGQFTPPLKSARRIPHRQARPQTSRDSGRLFGKARAGRAGLHQRAGEVLRGRVGARALNSRAIIKHYLYKTNLQFELTDHNFAPDNFTVPKD